MKIVLPKKKHTSRGYKVHALITLEGYITVFEITPAFTDDRERFRDLINGYSDIIVLAGKVYISRKPIQKQNICLFATKRSNSKENLPPNPCVN